MEAVQGCSRQIPLRVQASCSRCFGSGGEPGTKEQTCPYCRGRGEVSKEGRRIHLKAERMLYLRPNILTFLSYFFFGVFHQTSGDFGLNFLVLASAARHIY